MCPHPAHTTGTKGLFPPSLDLQSLGGEPGAHHVPAANPLHPPCSGTCVTSVPSCLPSVLGWGRLGVGGGCPLVPSAGLGAAPMSIHECWAAPWAVLCVG